LVTAGLIIFIKNNLIINFSYTKILIFISLITILISSIIAIIENDFKKIIALSTLRQIGLICLILSINLIKISFYHIITHAIFKARIFFSAGILIHYTFNDQMKQKIKIVENKLIVIIILLRNLALIAIPFTLGFFRKDLIIDYILIKPKFILLLIYLSVLLTIIYSIKVLLNLFKKQTNIIINKHDNLYYTFLSFVLFRFSIIFFSIIFNDYLYFYISIQFNKFKFI
jgi:NADH-ubiquinone oxidoreductase chain 5